VSLQERADEIARLFAEAARHAALGELTEAAEHAQQALTLLDDQIAALMCGDDT
jgi:hypothetical protein